jgi:hypothetical protein
MQRYTVSDLVRSLLGPNVLEKKKGFPNIHKIRPEAKRSETRIDNFPLPSLPTKEHVDRVLTTDSIQALLTVPAVPDARRKPSTISGSSGPVGKYRTSRRPRGLVGHSQRTVCGRT